METTRSLYGGVVVNGHSLWCKVCDWQGLPPDAEHHFKSGEHMHSCASLQEQRPPRYACPYCGIWATCEGNLQMHKDTDAHAARVTWLDPNRPGMPGSVRCNLCDVSGGADIGRSHLQDSPATSVDGTTESGTVLGSLLTDMEELLICPITHEHMQDPVIIADGSSFDRPAITRWFQHHSSSPLTGAHIADTTLQIPNRALRSLSSLYQRYHDPANE